MIAAAKAWRRSSASATRRPRGAPKIPSDGLGNSHLITWKSNVRCYLGRKNWSAARLFISRHKTMQNHCLQLKISKMFHRERCPSSFSRPFLAQLQHGRIIKTSTNKNTIQLWYNVNPGSINPYAVRLEGYNLRIRLRLSMEYPLYNLHHLWLNHPAQMFPAVKEFKSFQWHSSSHKYLTRKTLRHTDLQHLPHPSFAPRKLHHPTPLEIPSAGCLSTARTADADAVVAEDKLLQAAVFFEAFRQGLAVSGRKHRDGRPFFYGQGTGTDPGEIYRWGTSQTNITWMGITRP